MKYILPLFFILLLNGCNNSKISKPKEQNLTKKTNVKNNKTPTKLSNIITIKENNFELKFKENKLIYPKERMILLFENNSTYSKMQEVVLNKLNLKYYITNSPFLVKYFKIENYPTIVVLDKNKTVKYENFTPYEILKAEGF